MKITIWNENWQDRFQDDVKAAYPETIHGAIANFLKARGDEDWEIRIRTMDMEECGLKQEDLDDTDVMLYWGHLKHKEVPDEYALRIAERVHQGMGLILLHSAHASKAAKYLIGGGHGCGLTWREDDEHERVWTIAHNHPITKGIPQAFVVPADETYAEPFHIDTPDELIFITWYPGGEVFRSGIAYRRGAGKVFYFQPGHETFPIYREQKEVQDVIMNAIRWAGSGCSHYEFINDNGRSHGTRIEP
jgi:trehalose utilization protein